MEINWVAVIVAVLGAGGIGAAIREIVSVVTLSRQGVSGREDRRKADIVAQRDWAMEQMKVAQDEADENEQNFEAERYKRRLVEDAFTVARRKQMEQGLEPTPWPDFEDSEPRK